MLCYTVSYKGKTKEAGEMIERWQRASSLILPCISQEESIESRLRSLDCFLGRDVHSIHLNGSSSKNMARRENSPGMANDE